MAPGIRTRLATRMLLLVVLAASSLALTQCRMVGDTLTGVSVDSFKRKSSCVKACKDANKDELKAERNRHNLLKASCGGDHACREAEDARYEEAVKAIEEAYDACRNSCHNQGGGTVGP